MTLRFDLGSIDTTEQITLGDHRQKLLPSGTFVLGCSGNSAAGGISTQLIASHITEKKIGTYLLTDRNLTPILDLYHELDPSQTELPADARLFGSEPTTVLVLRFSNKIVVMAKAAAPKPVQVLDYDTGYCSQSGFDFTPDLRTLLFSKDKKLVVLQMNLLRPAPVHRHEMA